MPTVAEPKQKVGAGPEKRIVVALTTAGSQKATVELPKKRVSQTDEMITINMDFQHAKQWEFVGPTRGVEY